MSWFSHWSWVDNKEEVKEGTFKVFPSWGLKEAGSWRKKPNIREAKIEKQLATRWRFLWRRVTWEAGQQSLDVLSRGVAISNSEAQVTWQASVAFFPNMVERALFKHPLTSGPAVGTSKQQWLFLVFFNENSYCCYLSYSVSCLPCQLKEWNLKWKNWGEANSSLNSLFRCMIMLTGRLAKLTKDLWVVLFFFFSFSFFPLFLPCHPSFLLCPSSFHSLPSFFPPFSPSLLFFLSFSFLSFPFFINNLEKNLNEFLRAVLQQWKYSGSHMPSL